MLSIKWRLRTRIQTHRSIELSIPIERGSPVTHSVGHRDCLRSAKCAFRRSASHHHSPCLMPWLRERSTAPTVAAWVVDSPTQHALILEALHQILEASSSTSTTESSQWRFCTGAEMASVREQRHERPSRPLKEVRLSSPSGVPITTGLQTRTTLQPSFQA